MPDFQYLRPEDWKAFADVAAATATVIIALLVYFLNRRQHGLERQNFRLQLLELRTALIHRLRAAEFDIWSQQNKTATPDVRKLTAEIREIALQVDLLYSQDIAAMAADLFEKLRGIGDDWNAAVLVHARGSNSKISVPPKQRKISEAQLRLEITLDLSKLSERVAEASRIDEPYLLGEAKPNSGLSLP